jgi:diamine N-acetyltransferase
MLNDQVVGFIRAHFDENQAREELRCCIWRVSVLASAQGKGVGRYAIEAARAEAKNLGFNTLTVVWPPGEEGPGNFFHRLGFVDTGITEYGEVIGSQELS